MLIHTQSLISTEKAKMKTNNKIITNNKKNRNPIYETKNLKIKLNINQLQLK